MDFIYKKIWITIMSAALSACLLSGCGMKTSKEQPGENAAAQDVTSSDEMAAAEDRSSTDAVFEEKNLEVRAGEKDSLKVRANEGQESQQQKEDGAAYSAAENDEGTTENLGAEENAKMNVVINGTTFELELDNGAAAQEFKEMFPIALTMQELNGNEKHGDLPASLTQDTYTPGTIHEGDVLLWGSDTLVIFYESFSSSYSYTKIGRITDTSGLKEAVGKKSAKVRFE